MKPAGEGPRVQRGQCLELGFRVFPILGDGIVSSDMVCFQKPEILLQKLRLHMRDCFRDSDLEIG